MSIGLAGCAKKCTQAARLPPPRFQWAGLFLGEGWGRVCGRSEVTVLIILGQNETKQNTGFRKLGQKRAKIGLNGKC